MNRDGIDVAEPDLAAQRLGGGDGEHARAAADVDDALRPAALEQPVEMNEAAARGAVMAGAEGEPRLDLDADVVQANPRAIMAPMDEKAPGPHRREAGERARHPVAFLGDAEDRRARGLLIRRGGDQHADLILVRLKAEIGLHEPGPAAARPSLVGLEGASTPLRPARSSRR